MSTLTRRKTEVLEGGPLNAAGAEAAYPEILAPTDPTGGAAPLFALTTSTDLSGLVVGDWHAGQWLADSWQSRTKSAVAETPTMGAAGTLTAEAGTNYLLWCRPLGIWDGGPLVLCCVVPFQ